MMGWRAGIAGGLLQPVALSAITLLAVNDHVLKQEWAHPLTGKLSDVAGLAFFPLLLVAVLEVGQHGLSRYRGPSDSALYAAVAATGVAFALVQIAPPATEAYRVTLGALQHPLLAIDILLSGDVVALPRVAATPDATDLLALPALIVPSLLGRRSSRIASVPSSPHAGRPSIGALVH